VEREALGRSALEARAPGGDGGAVACARLTHHLDGDVHPRDEPALPDALEQPPHVDTGTEADLEDPFPRSWREQVERPAAASAVLPRHQVTHEPPQRAARVRELRDDRREELRHGQSLSNDMSHVNMTIYLSSWFGSAKTLLRGTAPRTRLRCPDRRGPPTVPSARRRGGRAPRPQRVATRRPRAAAARRRPDGAGNCSRVPR